MDTEVSVKDLAEDFQLTERQIQKLAKEHNLDGSPVIVALRRGVYAYRASVRGYTQYLRERGKGPAEDEEGNEINPAVETALLKRTQRYKLELQIDEEKGRLVDIEDVRTAWMEVQATLNSHIDAIPGRLASEIAEQIGADRAHLYDILLSESIAIREGIAHGLETLGTHHRDGGNSQATTETGSLGMG